MAASSSTSASNCVINKNSTSSVDPVEMLARLRKHAATIAKTGTTIDENDGIFTDDELHAFISMYVEGKIPDYQMSAWLMAVCFCPLGKRETATLTRCYAESGRLLEWPEMITKNSRPSRRPPLVDKHSTGGVGDKISLILAPLVAACGVCIPMMAGRGLGHTGGTIDKLETSFPGYKASPDSVEEFRNIVLGNCSDGSNGGNEKAKTGVGCAIVEAGSDLCPADRRIYALRDVTSTVSCLPLITASIMSKKIAERPDSLVLDVKYGQGAFMESFEDARLLAESMVSVGEANGLVPTTAFLTEHNHPIGRAVGNWVEVSECIDVLKGNLRRNESLKLSGNLIALVVVQAGRMLQQSGIYRKGLPSSEYNSKSVAREEEKKEEDPCLKYESMSLEECISHAYQVLDSGRALDKFHEMLLAQGAEPLHLKRALETPEAIPLADFVAEWKYEAKSSNESDADNCTIYISNIPARTIGDIAVDLGTGRKKTGEEVDGYAGLVFRKETGDPVAHGDVIVTIYTNRSQAVADAALERVRSSVSFTKKQNCTDDSLGKKEIAKRVVTHIVTKGGGTKPFTMPDFLLGGAKRALC